MAALATATLLLLQNAKARTLCVYKNITGSHSVLYKYCAKQLERLTNMCNIITDNNNEEITIIAYNYK